MPASKRLDTIWETALQLLDAANPHGLEVLGLRVDVFRIEEMRGPKQLDQIHLVRSDEWGKHVEFSGRELTEHLFSVANMYGFERSGTNGRFGNVINDGWSQPGVCYVVGWDKDRFRVVTVSFTSPLPAGHRDGWGWSCTDGAEHLAYLIAALFSNALSIGKPTVKAA